MQGEREHGQPGRGPGRDLAEHDVRLAAAALGAQPEQLGDGPGDGLPGGRIRDDRIRGAVGTPAAPGTAPPSASVVLRLRRTAEAGAARGGCAGAIGFGRPGERRGGVSGRLFVVDVQTGEAGAAGLLAAGGGGGGL
ncbi:hypothetical protein SSIG_06268 [Streptomyces filamentosus NRRL 11379]|nr:hypothetical protein SSIG_06268 [Streptomyces filamentosus NRRL 11379]